MGNGLSIVSSPQKNGIAAKIGFDQEIDLDSQIKAITEPSEIIRRAVDERDRNAVDTFSFKKYDH